MSFAVRFAVMAIKPPEKSPDEVRRHNPTVRFSETEYDRTKAAAEFQGYKHPTKFMRDAILEVVEAVEEKMPARKKRGRK